MTEPARPARRDRFSRAVRLALIVLAPLVLVGCGATNGQWAEPPDPLEPFNRAMFELNMGLDKHLGEPVAEVYTAVAPAPMRDGIHNFFRNLSMPFVIVNSLLQGRLEWAGEDTLRLLMNTTVGIGGIFDPATDAGLEHRDQNFGVTAGVWGLGPGPYLVLPIVGPTTATTLPDIPMRIVLSPVGIIGPGIEQVTAIGVGAVSEVEARRENLRRVREAVDPYSYVKSGYMQQQMEMIRRGRGEGEDLPFDELPDDIFEDESADDAEPNTRDEGAVDGGKQTDPGDDSE